MSQADSSFGKPNRAQTPVKGIICGDYGAAAESYYRQVGEESWVARHSRKRTIPVVKETKAHILIAATAKTRASLGGQQKTSPDKQFKMKRFADVQGKIQTNMPKKGSRMPQSTEGLMEELKAQGLRTERVELAQASEQQQEQS